MRRIPSLPGGAARRVVHVHGDAVAPDDVGVEDARRGGAGRLSARALAVQERVDLLRRAHAPERLDRGLLTLPLVPAQRPLDCVSHVASEHDDALAQPRAGGRLLVVAHRRRHDVARARLATAVDALEASSGERRPLCDPGSGDVVLRVVRRHVGAGRGGRRIGPSFHIGLRPSWAGDLSSRACDRSNPRGDTYRSPCPTDRAGGAGLRCRHSAGAEILKYPEGANPASHRETRSGRRPASSARSLRVDGAARTAMLPA